MKIQLEWLKEYVDFDLPSEKLNSLLTMSGLEVEASEWVELPGGGKVETVELNVTPNRGYCLSYIGVAREVAGLLRLPLRLPDALTQPGKAPEGTPATNRLTASNLEPDLCPRYAALAIENVSPGPSPQWLRDKLHAAGLRPINNIVDITNFVLMECGQPLHAFDYERLAGGTIIVRRAKENEAFESLAGDKLKLDPEDLVIADAEKPVALAGVMGGANSEVTAATRSVVLESACFDPASVRRTSKKYGLRTDSSYRFERGVDLEGTLAAQRRAADLIRDLAGGTLVADGIDIYPKPRPRSVIRLRTARVRKILGAALEAETIRDLLERLGLKIEEQTSGEEFQVEVPPFRPKLTREIDLIEEIARFNGFENILASHPVASVQPVRPAARQTAIRKVKETLSHLGYSEVVNYSFMEEDLARQFKTAFGAPQAETIALSNPISADMAVMNASLLPGLLKTAARNISKGQKTVKIFELGNVFFKNPGEEGNREKTSFAGLVCGPCEPDVWKPSGRRYDYYDLKGALETALAQFKLSLEYRRADRPFLSPDKSVDCLAAGEPVGFLGEVAPRLSRQLDLGSSAFVFELDFDALTPLFSKQIRFYPIPKYPETYRDISIVVDKSAKAGDIASVIRETGRPIISRVELYDHFEGQKLEAGKKSLTFALAFQSPTKTLADEEVNPVFEDIARTLSDKLGAVLR
ncbi:MAG: phenylalanine--tRNA ligase subunit beta [Nitrospinales bacterium]